MSNLFSFTLGAMAAAIVAFFAWSADLRSRANFFNEPTERDIIRRFGRPESTEHGPIHTALLYPHLGKTFILSRDGERLLSYQTGEASQLAHTVFAAVAAASEAAARATPTPTPHPAAAPTPNTRSGWGWRSSSSLDTRPR